MDQVTLSSGVQSSLRAIQQTSRLQAVNEQELATGRRDEQSNRLLERVSQSLTQRAADLAADKDRVNEALSTVQAANEGLAAIEESLKQARAVAEQYQQASDAEEKDRLQAEFDDIAQQIDDLAADSGANGLNLIDATPDDLTVTSSDPRQSTTTILGQASDSAALGLSLSVDSIDKALQKVRDIQDDYNAAADRLAEQNDHADEMIQNLKDAAEAQVESDLNKDAAEAKAAQTREQLSIAGLAIATQSERAVLQMF